MPELTVVIEPLSRAAFAPYGDVIEVVGNDSFQINDGRADRYDALATIDCEGSGKPPIISIVEARQYKLPETVTFLERHPFGSQAFLPQSNLPFIVVVAAPGDAMDATTLNAFVTNGRQGINYHRGTWHHVILTPFGDVSFVVVDRSDPGTNCQQHWFARGDQPMLDGSGLRGGRGQTLFRAEGDTRSHFA